MAGFYGQMEDLVVAAAGTTTRTVNSADETVDATSIYIQAPAVMPESGVIQTSFDGSTWVTLNDGTADVVAPAVGKGAVYDNLTAPYWRILLGGAAGAERRFKVSKIWNAY